MTVCKERWFEIVEVLPRPLTRWAFALLAAAYGVRAVVGLPFDETTFGVLAAATGFTYAARGIEKITGERSNA